MRLRAPIFRSLHLFGLLVCGVLTVLVVLTGQFTATATTSTSVIKCTGFAGCTDRGYSNFGYSAVYKQSFWGATAGHNCTNYVAYRLSHHGRMAPKPSSLGSASHWGVNVKQDGIPVVSTPKVGDVAWWSYLEGSPIRSHVAIVEKVDTNGTILVSEDNLGGTFDWRTISPGDRFPSGFIRFPQSDGSPTGKAEAATNLSGTVTVRAYNDEPDSVGRASTILVSWGGPRGAAGTVQSSPSKPLGGHWHLYRTFSAGKVPQVAYLYALNTPGTKGTDHFYGKVAIPGGTVPDVEPTTGASPAPTADAAPRATTTLLGGSTKAVVTGNVRIRATVTDQAGARVRGTATMTGPGGFARTITLADGTGVFEFANSFPLGTHDLQVRYDGSSVAAPSIAPRSLHSYSTTAIAMSVITKPSLEKAGTATVTVWGRTAAKPTGQVTVFLKKKGQTTKKVWAQVKDGRVTLTLPRTSKRGDWTAIARYHGSTDHTAVDTRYTIRNTR